jgi:hypothetical protein
MKQEIQYSAGNSRAAAFVRGTDNGIYHLGSFRKFGYNQSRADGKCDG